MVDAHDVHDTRGFVDAVDQRVGPSPGRVLGRDQVWFTKKSHDRFP